MNEQVLVPERRGRKHRAARFKTAEERAALKHNSFLPYFRLHDSLCRSFLQLASDPAEFAGLKLLFPFVREMSVLGVARNREAVPGWMQLAFLAGHDLGRAHPELVEEVLPGYEPREATRRVAMIRRYSGEDALTQPGLKTAFTRIVEAQFTAAQNADLESALVEGALKSLRTGFAAGTVCQADPALCEFVWDIPVRTRDYQDIIGQLVIGAPLRALERPALAALEHPLLRMSRGLYPAQRVECETVREFLGSHLRAIGAKTETECPGSESDLLGWIDAGTRFGERIERERPDVLSDIFAAAHGRRLDDAVSVVKEVVADAGGTDAPQLLGRLKRWHENLWGWWTADNYAEKLARIIYLADFAVWIPWVMSGQAERSSRAPLG